MKNHPSYTLHYTYNSMNNAGKRTKQGKHMPLQSISQALCILPCIPCILPSSVPALFPEPAPQATLDPLTETVKNAPCRPLPYDRTSHPLQLATSSITPLRAFEHVISRPKQPFSGKSSHKSSSTHHEFLYINPSSHCCDVYHTSGCTPRLFAIVPRPSSALPLPIPLLLLLESPLSRTPAFPDELPFQTAFRRMRTILTPKVNLSEQGRLSCSLLHYAGAALVDHVVLKGVKMETQADRTMLPQALAFVALRTTKRVIRGPQNTFPIIPRSLSLKGGAR